MRSNGLLKWLTIPLVLVVVFVGIRLSSDAPDATATQQSSESDAPELSPSEMAALGIEGDTPDDTIATLVAQVKQLRSELGEATSTNKRQQTETERLRIRDHTIDERIENVVSREREQWHREAERNRAEEQQQTNGLFEELRNRLDNNAGDANDDLPVGFGLTELERRTHLGAADSMDRSTGSSAPE